MSLSYGKMAEPMEMQFDWVGWVQGACITWRADAATGRSTFTVSGRLKSIVKHRI